MDDWVYRIGSPTNRIGRPPRFFRSDKLVVNGARFASVYAVREMDAKAIEDTAQTCAGFKGIVWSRRLWIDFDSYEAANRAETRIKEMGYDFVVYDTGGRGRHLGVLRDVRPSHTLPAQDKEWVEEHFPEADLSLYWHLHLIRLPGAVHERTGRSKQRIRVYAGRELILQPVRDTISATSSIGSTSTVSRSSIFNTWSIVSLLSRTGEGDRHRRMVRLSCALKEAQVTKEEALWVVLEVNRGFQEPKPEEEVIRIVDWSYEENR